MARAPFKQFKIDSLGFVFLNHLSNNKPKAGGGGPLSIQTRKNCFEKHTPQTQNRNTKNIKGNQMLQQKEKKRRRRKSPLSLSKKPTWNFLNFGYKVLRPLFFFKKKKKQQHDRDLHKQRSDVLIRHGNTKYRDIQW
jgi:hypothetical protein